MQARFLIGDTLHPEWVACEQVPEVLPIWRAICERLRAAGYSTWAGILNSADHGVPQTRQRAILMASRVGVAQPPVPTHAEYPHPSILGDTALPWVSMAEALGCDRLSVLRSNNTVAGGPRAERGASSPALTVTSGSAGRWVLAANRGQEPDGSRQEVGIDRPAPSVTGKAYGRWQLRAGPQAHATVRPVTEPAPTIMATLDNGGAEWVYSRPATTVMGTPRVFPANGHHPEMGLGHASTRAVKVTLGEMAILQDFPPYHPFAGTKESRARQIGNACPAGLARHIVAALTSTKGAR